MKLTTGMLFLTMMAGSAGGQNPDIIENTRNTLKAVQQKKTMDENAVLSSSGQAAKPAAPVSRQPTAGSAAGKSSPSTKSAPKAAPLVHAAPAPKVAAKTTTAKTAAPKAAAPKTAAPKTVAPKTVALKKSQPKQRIAVADKKKPEARQEASKVINMTGRRDPFVSPVVNRSMFGSGCSSGKKCLAIEQVDLKGVVKSDNGMIAVVVNAMNKAYFLRENDPVFNGYVVKITGDSIVFKENMQDKLGKPFTREVTKKIITPAV